MMDMTSRFKTVTILVVLSCLLQMRMPVSFLDVPYLFVVEFIIKYAICATVDPLVVPPADQSKLFRILQCLF